MSFAVIVIDEGCWADPTVYGPFASEEEATLAAERVAEPADESLDPVTDKYIIRPLTPGGTTT